PEAAASFLATVRALLRPGGVLGIIDHSGRPGGDQEALHRMEEKDARRLALVAGFEVEASDLLRNPADDRTLYVFDPTIRGKTDRFVLKLRKPE
ncbi:MAG: SAM-dependent methyltransferase, partial [Myxococcales bacterium]|nr:SAM-dependent methyltransferase [Myxococcales bacterium]